MLITLYDTRLYTLFISTCVKLIVLCQLCHWVSHAVVFFGYILLIFVFDPSEIMSSNAEASLHKGIYLIGELVSACFSKLILSVTDLLNKAQTGRRGEMDPGSLAKHYEYCSTVQKPYIKVKKNGFEDNTNLKTSPQVIAWIKQYHCLFLVFVIYPSPLLLRRSD